MQAVRVLFRLFNLLVYAIFISILGFFYLLGDIDTELENLFGSNVLTPMGYGILAAFLLGNMIFILVFRFRRTNQNVEWMYYLCDAVIRITFTIPLCFVIYYYVVTRFLPLDNVILSDIVLFILFFIWDYLMRWQIRFQMRANYFKTNNHL